jgi:hypothetical protein
MINNISLILSILVCLIGIVRFTKLTMPFKLLVILQLIDLLLTTLGVKLVETKYRNNALILHVQACNSFIFYTIIYYLLLKNKHIKKFLLVFIFIVPIFCFINALFLEPYITTFPTYIMLPTDILLIIFSLLLFKQMLLYPVQVNIVRQSVFWYNIGILFFSATMFMNLGLMNYYSHHGIRGHIVYYFWFSAIIIFNLLLGIAILTDRKEAATING